MRLWLFFKKKTSGTPPIEPQLPPQLSLSGININILFMGNIYFIYRSITAFTYNSIFHNSISNSIHCANIALIRNLDCLI